MFCSEVQKLLKPIYDLTRKGRSFIWGKEQDSFDQIKHRLVKLPVLHMPNKTGRFHLYSYTSKFVTGSALYHIQNGTPKLIAYVSKRVPEATKSYSITELELCGLAINIASFSHLLKRVDFDTIVDHLALMHIIKSKVESAVTRMKRLLELISSYSFNLYYMKGKDMILSDFLSCQKNDNNNPHEIIPISFNMFQVLDDNYYSKKYLIQTRSHAKSSGIKLPEVCGMGKDLDPNLKPEKHTMLKQGSKERSCIGKGRAGSKRKRPDAINQSINQPSNWSWIIPGRMEIESGKTNHVHPKDLTHSVNNGSGKMTNNNLLIPDVPFHPGPVCKPLPKPIKQDMSYPQGLQSSTSIEDINPNINFDFEENCPFQEGIMSETFQRLDKSFFQEPKELGDFINKGNLIHMYLPKQTDIDKILEVIQRKVLKGTHLLVKVKEIQAGYLHSSYFKDLHLYLSQNKLPSSKSVIKRIEMLAEKYILVDSLLFKIAPEKETAVLVVPKSCIDKVVALYHSSLSTGHQGVITT